MSGATSTRDSVVALGERCPVSAAAMSAPLPNRSAGAFARQRVTIASVASSTSGARRRSGGGGSRTIDVSTWAIESPVNGRSPESIS